MRGLIFTAQIFGTALAPTACISQDIGLTVAPKDKETLDEEQRNPVAANCAKVADILATKSNATVGNVSIISDPDRGTVWRGTLLIHREPPFAPPMECTATKFTVLGKTFDPKTPPADFPWPRVGR